MREFGTNIVIMDSRSRVLVTGGSGFIGTNLVSKLKELGCTITVLDDYSSGSRDNEITGVTYVESSDLILNYRGTQKYDYIFHLAALSRIQPSFVAPYKTFINNVQLTAQVCEYVRANGGKLVYAGSSSRHHDPYQSPYATTKYLGEEVCKMYRIVYSLNIEIARFYNVYGPKEILEGKDAAVVGIFRNLIYNNKPLTIVGDGEQRRDFTHVTDIVQGLVKIATSSEKHDDAWELGTGVNFSINELADMFVKKYNCSKEYIPEQKGNYRETLQLNTDAQNRLDYSPTDKLQEYIDSL